MSRCKCPKSDMKTDAHTSWYSENITKMQERRCDLVGRQKYLKDKITTMERSIPALIAYNMWMGKECESAPYCKIREIMKTFAPYPDQTEKLLKSLKNTVKELNCETEELHEKIIQADVILEETEMELESLELVNKEMNDTLNNLEKEMRCYTTPSLHSIHSEDLLCLSKIRQLAEEELNLKNCIKALEQNETIFNEHVNRLLTSKEYQNVRGRKKISCIQDPECNGNKICYVPKKCLWSKQNDLKKKQKQEIIVQSNALVSTSEQNIKKQDQEIKPEMPQENVGKKSSWILNWWSNNQKSEQVLPQMKRADASASMNIKNKVQKFTLPLDEKTNNDKSSSKSKSKSAQCHRPCFTPQDLQCILRKSCVEKHIPPCNISCNKLTKCCATSSRKPFCELPRYTMADHGIRTGCKPRVVPCDFNSPCEICPSIPFKSYVYPLRNCRCNCKGKCSRGLSDAPCNCSDEPLDSSEGYQPTGSKQLDDSRRDEDSEDEFCECCSCGCEDSDESLLCQCN
ncbi:PREDICTED: uncharacterized protein LOC108554254 [Eufriesea mexicana]|uniref:uncharacterized protein LOC108554254 n=1 Tax=Eufriesea mexicana TaxID=516756 RepID=UPI00083BFEE1|nr:PREDICTED: uncharacterized protein LOC108554254 [Eufriesea mexicana]